MEEYYGDSIINFNEDGSDCSTVSRVRPFSECTNGIN